jgi:hypothetical protein
MDFIAVSIAIGLTNSAKPSLAWNVDDIFANKFAQETMTLIEYEQIKRFLHCADNTTNDQDPLHKIRRMLEMLKASCKRCWNLNQAISVDEMDIAFQGMHRNKERITYKRAGDGFLVYALCDTNGYVFDYNIKFDPQWCRNNNGLSATFSAVIELLKSVPATNEWHHVYVDNLYGNVALAEECYRRKILFTSTMRSNRVPKELKLPPGAPLGAFVRLSMGHVTVVRWKDRREVLFATTAHNPIRQMN